MKVELVQIAGRDGDTAHNLERALAAIADCAADTELVVFPETHLTGFPSEDNIASLAEPLDGPTVSAVQRVARERNVSVAIGIDCRQDIVDDSGSTASLPRDKDVQEPHR